MRQPSSDTWVTERWEDLGEAPATREDGVPMYRRRSGRRARDANPPAHPRGRAVTVLRELLVVVAWALLIAFVAKHVLVRGFLIPSDAMAPTLVSGDRVFVNVLDTTLRPADRGDVIVFNDTQGWLPPADEPSSLWDWINDGMAFLGVTVDDSDNHVVKRVIGVGGDRVTCCDSQGRLMINDVPVEEAGTYLPPGEPASDTPFDVIVPDDHYFVLGDRRSASGDSRFYLPENRAFVSQHDVIGTAFVVTWPLNRSGALTDYTTVFEAVPDTPATQRSNRWA
ncbi:signal peptidase I [Kocuria sp.]|uniref:signal peptidase I n=1 Tax=Kocuria sp. TaxID=1871328 RepID=UPI0026DFE092|nr:signal peptidase I [Kocuria sp.]MDO5618288.1 signal peptidase I [Kocuria sp.]